MSPVLQQSPPFADWLQQYSPVSARHDEYRDASGQPRPHWQTTHRALGEIQQDSWLRRENQLSHLIEDNGITYNVYADNPDKDEAWSVDMIPYLLKESDYSYLSSALSQRARLLNLTLADLYGRQSMLDKRKIDPFLIYANPAFSRACHGIKQKNAPHVTVYAADVARSSEGKWWVVSDRVEAVSGLGYALDNRMLISRLFPKTLSLANTKRLNPYLNGFCHCIESLAQHNTDNPNIALLTPGPKNETYYEHSFLARNLGFTLAEGADLTVHNNRLYMKTVGGTQQIDVLLRRVDTDWTDPLEMRNESLLGVPGLLNCVRQGNLTITNALGAGLAETTAFPAFWPWLARDYLGEQLEMPSVATWWCGQPSECRYVLENLAGLVIKRTFRSFNSQTIFGANLSPQELSALRSKIQAHPERYCAQEILKSATTPVYHQRRVEPRPYLLRVFLSRQADGTWQMMPGGFARCASNTQSTNVSMQAGGCSKDVWVVPDTPTHAPIAALAQSQTQSQSSASNSSTAKSDASHSAPQLQRRHIDLPSRTADNLFWLGRYIERAEMQTRLLRTTIQLLLEEQLPETQRACLPFIQQINRSIPFESKISQAHNTRIDTTRIEASIQRSLNDSKNYDSLINHLSAIERIAESLKERLSIDSWKRIQSISKLSEEAKALEVSIFDPESSHFLDTALQHLTSLTGNITENMTRSQSWSFMQLGRRIERGIASAHLYSEVFSDPSQFNDTLYQRLLELCDCSITYRRRYLNTFHAIPILDILVFDQTNPRSLIFQAEQLRDVLGQLPHGSSYQRHPLNTVSTQLYSQIGITQADTLIPKWQSQPPQASKQFFLSIIETFSQLSRLIETNYFAHTQSMQPNKRTLPLE